MIKLTSEADQVCVAKAQEAGQSHIFDAWETLPPETQRALITQVRGVDFQLLERLVHEQVESRESPAAALPSLLKPASFEPLPSPELSTEDYELCRTLGEYAYRNREVLLVTAAGGCCQPLFEKPLGLQPVGPITSKSLLQLFAEKIQALNRRYRTSLRWTIVCHPAERETVHQFLKSQGYFGLACADVSVSEQDFLPVVDRRGKILLDNPGHMVTQPTGHGGVILRLLEDGRLEAVESAGIRHILYFQVDNPLVNLADPAFLGFHIKNQCDVSSKCVRKTCPDEKVGVFGTRNGVLRVVEHNELSAEDREARSPDGSLAYCSANIGVHLFSLEFLSRLREEGLELPFHCVERATPYLGRQGKTVRPAKPNSFKFVTYAFDVLPFARRTRILEVQREDEFSPIKLPSGQKDSLETARRDLSRLHGRWLARVVPGFEQREDRPVEISPLYASSPEELAEKVELPLPETKSGILLGGRP